MSWTHSSSAVTAALLLVLFGAVGTAVAIDVSSENAPDQAEVGTEVTTTITIDDPYTGENVPSEYTLRSGTDLENVSWTIEETFQGDPSGDDSAGTQTFEQQVPLDGEQGDTITITVTGEVPAVDNYTYENEENFTLYQIERVTGNNAQTLDSKTVNHYTAESQEARQAIDSASAAIEEAGGDQEASDRLDQAISAYNQGNFENAVSIAEDAESIAEQTQQSQETTQLLLFGGVGVVVLLLIGGGVYYYRQQQQDTYKLQ